MSEWEEVRLADVCTKPQYGAAISSSDDPSGPRFVRQTDITTGRIDWSSVPHCNLPDEDVPKYALRAGDLLVSRLGNGVGNAATVQDPRGAVFAGYLVRFQVDPTHAIPEFVGYQLQAPSWRAHVLGYSSGAAQPTMNARQMGDFRFQLPSLEEQRRIASVLGAFDDLIENNWRLGEAMAAEQTADFLTTWDESMAMLGDIARITMGQSPPGSSYNEDGTGTAFYQGVRDFGWRFPANRVWTTEPKRMAGQGDALVAVRAPVGETNIATETTALGRGLAGVRAEGRQATLHQALTAMPSIWHIHQGTGTVFASINKQGMNALEVPWVDEDALEHRLVASDRAIAALHEEIADLTRTRDELLPLLMSGRVRVKDVDPPKGGP